MEIALLQDEPMMSSREIADLTKKDHKNVIRDIRVMLDDLQKDGSNLGHHFREEKDARGYTSMFYLNRELTDTLLTGYSTAARLVVVRRWHILEAEALEQKNQVTLPNYPEALRQLAHQLETNGKLIEQQILDAPKVKVFHSIMLTDEHETCRTAFKTMGWPEKKAFDYMHLKRWTFRKGGGSWSPMKTTQLAGYLDLKVYEWKDNKGEPHTRDSMVMTQKGKAKLIDMQEDFMQTMCVKELYCGRGSMPDQNEMF